MPSLAPTRLSLNGRVILCLIVTVWAAGALLHIRITRARADREQNRATQKVSPGARAIAPLIPAGSTYTWVGGTPAVTTDWTVATNWNPQRVTPAATDNLVFDGAGTPSPTITNIPTETIATLSFFNGVTATFNAASGSQLTITGATGSDLSIPSGTSLTLASSNPLTISLSAGAKAIVGGQIIFQDAAQRLNAADASGVTFQSSSIFTTTTGFTGNPFGTGTNGSVVFQSGAAGFFNAGSDPFGGSTHSVATFNLGSSQTFTAASAFATDGRTYGNLTLDGNQAYAGSGTGVLTIFNTLTIVSGSTLTLSSSSGGDLNLLGDIAVHGTLSTNGRTVKFQGGSATQNLTTAATFGDVSISKTGGTVKLGGALTVNGALQFDGTISAVDVLEFNQNTLNLNGTIGGASSSSFNGFKGDATGATLNIGGTGALGTLKFVNGAQSLKSLTVNRTSSGTLFLGTNLTIGNASVGSLTLTNGVVDVGFSTLSLASFPTITRTNGYVIGNLQKTFASTGNFTFTVGTANGYSPVDANVTAGAGNSLTVQAIQGKQPNFYTSNALQRYWRMSNSSATADLTFHYLASDVVGTEANYKILRFGGGFAQFNSSGPINTSDPANHFVTVNGVALNGGPYPSFDWTLADPTLTVNTTADANDACTALGTGNGCSLREAINTANSSGDPNPINFSFDPGDAGCVSGVCTITLGSALADLNANVTITGTGANSLIVKRSTQVGTPNFRIFTIGSGVTASISGLTVTNGHSADGVTASSGTFALNGQSGGGISNAGTLTLSNVRVIGNSTGNGVASIPSTISFAGQGGDGGGIFNSGTLTMTDVTVDGNTTGNGGLGGTGSSQYGGPGGDGAGIYSSGPLTLTRVTVTNNTAGNGNTGGAGGSGGSGGGVAHSALLTMTDCVISGNMTGQGAVGSNPGASSASSGAGGGILGVFYPTGTLIMKSSTVTGNRTADGPSTGSGGSGGTGAGVVVNYNASGKIINSTISNNRTGDGLTPIAQGGFGGGVYNGGTLEIIGSTISGNQTGASSDGGGSLGGGIENDSDLTVTNSTISGNRTGGIGGYGGGIVNNRTLTLINVTVTNNTSFANVGHGISQFSFLATPPNIRNSIIAGNGQGLPGSDINGDCTSGGYNLIGNADNTTGFNAVGDQKGTSSAPLNALLGLLANNGGPTMTHALLPGSPAINAGSNANLPADTLDLDGDSNTTELLPVDQRGFARVALGTVDIGAFESRGFSISASSGTPQSTPILTSFASTLVATVTSAFSEPVAGGVVTFTAPASEASGTFAGGVTTVNVSTNSSGVATSPTFTANGIAGSYGVTVSGSGITSPANFSLTNTKANTSTSVSSSMNPSDFGQNVTFTATVSGAGAPVGTVLFTDGAAVLGPANCVLNTGSSCTAQFTTSTLSPGLHPIAASYNPDGNHLASNGSLSGGGQTVNSILSIDDASATEGDNGTKILTFTVTLTATNIPVTVDYETSPGTATPGIDYVSQSGPLTFNAGQTKKTIDVTVTGDQTFEADETFFVNLSNATNATISKAQGTGTIGNDDAQGGIISFIQSNYLVNESGGSVTITVTRGGDTSGSASVDYSTPDDSEVASVPPCSQTDGIARPRCDFTTAVGTLQFAGGETSKTFTVLISQDNFFEGPEALQLALSNLTGGAVFGTNSTAILTINDDDVAPSTSNPIDDPETFVRQHYHDFLNREPDASGLDFWKHQITDCGGDPQCIEVKRINVSGAFYLSIEFQGTGYLVERMYKAAYGDVTATSSFGGAHQVQVPVVRFNEFLRDTQKIGQGVIVGAPGWENQLETNKNSFAADFVKRSRFSSAYPTSLSPTDFVNQLFAKTGVTPAPAESQSAIDEFGGAPDTTNLAARGRVLRKVAENPAFNQAEFNRAFVLMQYFGYLRRNPNAEASADYTGYDFWLTKLNQFGGNFQNAEMVKAFISADEYRHRFGP